MPERNQTAWIEHLLKQGSQTKLAHNAVQVAKNAKQFESVNRLVRKTQDRVFGEDDDVAEDDMQIRFDSPETHTHNYPPKQAMGGLAKIALGVALAAGTGGLGLAALAVWELMQRPPAATDTDSDTILELTLEP